jgi:uncharacterized membrane protein YfcA
MALLPLLILGFAAGIFSGMFGIGGGVIIVPVLIVFLGFTPVSAIATSLGALMLPVGILGVLAYQRQKLVDIRSAGLIALGLLTTSFIGASITLSLPADTLKQVYGVFLFLMGWRFAEPRKYVRERQGITAAPVPMTNSVDDPAAVPWYVVLIVGLVAGILSGMFGIGGGVVIVPALVTLLKYDQKLAVGTSLGALLLPVGLPGVLNYYQAGQLDIAVAIPVAIGLAIGALGGARIALGMSSKTVKRLYGLFLMVVGLWFVIQPLLGL